MVPVWWAIAAWLAAWTALAWLSMGLLRRVRPGERVPMARRADGGPAMRVSPGVAAAFLPALATVAGVVTIGVSLTYSHDKAPLANVFLAAVFVAAHWMQITTGLKFLEQERGGSGPPTAK